MYNNAKAKKNEQKCEEEEKLKKATQYHKNYEKMKIQLDFSYTILV